MRTIITDLESFYKFVDKSGDCWLWTRRINRSGYGALSFHHVKWLAHRFAWMMERGEIPNDKPQVLHKCDVRRCVRVEHLFIGTHNDNMRDMAQKGRAMSYGGDEHWTRKCSEKKIKISGSNNHESKLTEAIVREIRRIHAEGCLNYVQMAPMFGITSGALGKIVRGDAWAHVKNEVTELFLS